jgi:Ca2+/Na+ antiporter
MSFQQPGESVSSSGKHRHRRKRRSVQLRRDQPPAVPPVRNTLLETVVEILLGSVLVFAPFAFGAVEGWSQLILFSLVGLLCICFFLHLLISRKLPVVGTWTYLPIALYLLLIFVQLVPLSSRVTGLISPNTAALRTKLLGDLPNAGQVLKQATLSFYPAATRRDLRVVLAAAAVFVVVINHYRRLEQIRRLLITIVVIAVAVSLLALAQDITGTTNIYWLVRPGRGVASAGPFYSYSHYGQFMNLSVGAAAGLLLVELHRILHRLGEPGSAPLKPLFDRKHRVAWLLGLFIVIGIVTVFLSGSRGAMIGLLVALGFASLTLSGTRGLEGNLWFLIPLAVTACAVVLFFGPQVVFDRFSTLENPSYYSDRIQIVKDLTAEWKQFPVVGTGLGTHEFIYPMYDHSTRLDTATHAENEYAQAMEETGAAGLMMVLLFAMMIWSHYFRAVRNADPPIRLAGIGLGIGLVTVQVHSLSDFGQHLPANACLTAVVCGLLISLSRLRQYQRMQLKALGAAAPADADADGSPPVHEESLAKGESDNPRQVQRWVMRAGLLAGVGFISVWQVRGALGDYRAETNWKLAAEGREKFLTARGWDASNEQYKEILEFAAAASALAPDDIKYRYSLDMYRWHAITRVRDPDTNALRYNAMTIGYAGRIAADLQQARVLCPTYAHVLLLEGEIEFSPLLGDPAGPDHIRLAFQLSRCDQTAAGMTARCDVNDARSEAALEEQFLTESKSEEAIEQLCTSQGKSDEAAEHHRLATAKLEESAEHHRLAEAKWMESVEHFRRFLDLAGDYKDVIDAYVAQNHRSDLALVLAHNKITDLTLLADSVAATDAAVAARARDEAYDVLKIKGAKPDAPASLLVTLAEQHVARNNYPAAITAYRRALASEYGNVAWHYSIAELLAHEGDYAEAIREAGAGQPYPPRPEARERIENIRLLQAAAEEKKSFIATTRAATRPTTRAANQPATGRTTTEPTVGPASEPSATP